MRAAWFLTLVLVLWGAALLLQVPDDPPEVQPLEDGGQLRLFVPPSKPPWPALVCLHSIFQDADTAEAPARASARAGVAGVQVLLAPGGAFEDHLASVRQVLALLRRDPRIRSISLYGHSMGADLACTLAAEDPGLAGVVTAGFPVEASPGSPARLLLVVGAWDELHPLSEMVSAALRAGAPLLVLEAADHAAETVSPQLFEALAGWCGGRQGVALRPDPFVGRGLLALGLVLPAWAGMRAVWLRGRRWPAVLAALLLAGSTVVPVPGIPAAVALAALLAASLAGSDLPTLLPLAARRLVVLLAVAGAALAVNSWQAVADSPQRILGLLAFLAQAPPLAAARAGSSLAPLGWPGWMAESWLAAEFLAPGALASGVTRVHRHLVAALRRLDLRPRLDVSPGPALVLLGCLGVAACLWREVTRAGYLLESAEMMRLGGLFARLGALPVGLLAAAVRTGRWGDAEAHGDPGQDVPQGPRARS